MKSIVGLVFVFAGILSAFYGGLWWAFVGGIVQVINAVRADVLVESQVAFGIAKIVFSGFFGWLFSMPFFLIAMLFLHEDDARKLMRRNKPIV